MNADVVVRLHHTLLDALEEAGRDPTAQPVTVAEIYQDLVPYRRARASLGVELNADFEHALLRLLSGEDGRARIEPGNVRDALRRELTSPNPNVGLYRQYAACDVWVQPAPEAERSYAPPARRGGSPPAADRPVSTERPDVLDLRGPHDILPREEAEAVAGAGSDAPGDWAPRDGRAAGSDDEDRAGARAQPETEPPAASVDGGPRQEPETMQDAFFDPADAGFEIDDEQAAEAAAEVASLRVESGTAASRASGGRPDPADAAGADSACAFCSERLPHGRDVRFCPHCGQDQRRVPCASCGAVLEPDWRYCVDCGATVAP